MVHGSTYGVFRADQKMFEILGLSSRESFMALKYSHLAFEFEGPKILQSGEL